MKEYIVYLKYGMYERSMFVRATSNHNAHYVAQEKMESDGENDWVVTNVREVVP